MSSLKRGFGVIFALACSLIAFEGCGGKSKAPAIDPYGSGGGGGASSGGSSSASGGKSDKDGSAGDANTVVDSNCGPGLLCSGHSHCSLANSGVGATAAGSCLCDTGYIRVLPDGGTATTPRNDLPCVVDETCFRLHTLEKTSCRYEAGVSPAVGMFFAVDYCAGTAVLPDRIGDLTTAFQITENKTPVPNSPEVSATVIKHSVESYLTFVLDFSASLTSNAQYVTDLIHDLRTVLASAAPGPGEPPLAVSIIAFGRNIVQETGGFTRSAAAVDTVLTSLASDPGAVTGAVGLNGTSINQAVEVGINSTERIQALREGVSNRGVLTSGTVVVVTDGSDDSGWVLNTGLIQNTRVNVLTIGIGSNVDRAALSAIGRDGTFLAQTSKDWTPAFQEVADRVQNYPKRAYLLGYCSSATVGPQKMAVALNPAVFRNATIEASASCDFNADYFGTNPNAVCNAASFLNACANTECGGIAGCGACSDDKCCNGTTCQAPGLGDDCHNQDALCAPAGKVCIPVPGAPTPQFYCAAPAGNGEKCDTLECQPGAEYCAPADAQGVRVCQPIVPPTAAAPTCGTADDHSGRVCASLNCAQSKPQNPVDAFVCQPPALAYDRCGGKTASAVCESGTACQLSGASYDDLQMLCLPRQITGCTTDLDCITGHCQSGSCIGTGACYYAWKDKIAG